MINNLKQMEILFDEKEIQLYYFAKKKIINLKAVAQKSEIWLSDFLKQPKNDTKIREVINDILDIQSMLSNKQEVVNKNLRKIKFRHKDINKKR